MKCSLEEFFANFYQVFQCQYRWFQKFWKIACCVIISYFATSLNIAHQSICSRPSHVLVTVKWNNSCSGIMLLSSCLPILLFNSWNQGLRLRHLYITQTTLNGKYHWKSNIIEDVCATCKYFRIICVLAVNFSRLCLHIYALSLAEGEFVWILEMNKCASQESEFITNLMSSDGLVVVLVLLPLHTLLSFNKLGYDMVYFFAELWTFYIAFCQASAFVPISFSSSWVGFVSLNIRSTLLETYLRMKY